MGIRCENARATSARQLLAPATSCHSARDPDSHEPNTCNTRTSDIEPDSTPTSSARRWRQELALEFCKLGFELTKMERSRLVPLSLGLRERGERVSTKVWEQGH